MRANYLTTISKRKKQSELCVFVFYVNSSIKYSQFIHKTHHAYTRTYTYTICTSIHAYISNKFLFVCVFLLTVHTLSAAIEMDKLDANLEQQFDLNLIEAVKMNPVIYDRSHYNYKHFVRKAQTWKQIAETLGVSGK